MSNPAEKLQIAPGVAQVSAAKLHVLQLGPIKDRLGVKWAKLSGLVHQLFEAAIRDAQGPRDHFVRLDELSYVVTFHGLSFDEATLACTAVAQKVCEKLFGGTGGGIAVRALVGQLAEEVLEQQFKDGKHIAAHLELNGQEIVVSSDPGRIPPTTKAAEPRRVGYLRSCGNLFVGKPVCLRVRVHKNNFWINKQYYFAFQLTFVLCKVSL